MKNEQSIIADYIEDIFKIPNICEKIFYFQKEKYGITNIYSFFREINKDFINIYNSIIYERIMIDKYLYDTINISLIVINSDLWNKDITYYKHDVKGIEYMIKIIKQIIKTDELYIFFYINKRIFERYINQFDYYFQNYIYTLLIDSNKYISIINYIINLYPNIYKGDYNENGLPHGKGIITMYNKEFNGEFINGVKNGEFRDIKGNYKILYDNDKIIKAVINQNDYEYEGEISENFDELIINGYGKYKNKKNTKYKDVIYEGMFLNGNIIKGKLYFEKDKYYEGTFYNFFPHGVGKVYDEIRCTLLEGEWNMDMLNGGVKYTHIKHNIIAHERYINNIPDEIVNVNYNNYKNIRSFKGIITNKNYIELNGNGTLEYSDNKVYKGDIINLKKHGKGIYENVYCENWNDDKKNGKGYIIENNTLVNKIWTNDLEINPLKNLNLSKICIYGFRDLYLEKLIEDYNGKIICVNEYTYNNEEFKYFLINDTEDYTKLNTRILYYIRRNDIPMFYKSDFIKYFNEFNFPTYEIKYNIIDNLRCNTIINSKHNIRKCLKNKMKNSENCKLHTK